MNPLQPCPQDCPTIKASQRSPRQLRLQLHTNHPSNLLQSHHVSSHPSLLHSPQVTLPPISRRKENQLSIPKSAYTPAFAPDSPSSHPGLIPSQMLSASLASHLLRGLMPSISLSLAFFFHLVSVLHPSLQHLNVLDSALL